MQCINKLYLYKVTFALNWLGGATGCSFAIEQRQNDRRFADDIFKFTSMYKLCFIVVKITLEFVTKGPIN